MKGQQYGELQALSDHPDIKVEQYGDSRCIHREEVTEEVCLLSRWMAANLLHGEIDALRSELSMSEAADELRVRVPHAREPYRELLRDVRDRLSATRRQIERRLEGRDSDGGPTYEETMKLFQAFQPYQLEKYRFHDALTGAVRTSDTTPSATASRRSTRACARASA